MTSGSWQAEARCRKCAAAILVCLEAGASEAPGLAVFYCPACGERCQAEHPAGYDPLTIVATQIPS